MHARRAGLRYPLAWALDSGDSRLSGADCFFPHHHGDLLTMFGNHRVPLASRAVFVSRLFRSLAMSILLIAFSLAIGVAGYVWISNLSPVDAFLNASMILGGMGPVAPMDGDKATAASKIFAACYALFSGLVLVGATGLVLGPVLHRIIHRLHLDDLDDLDDKAASTSSEK